MIQLSRSIPTIVGGACLAVFALAGSGCMLGQLVGGMVASAERQGTSDIKPKYAGLAGRNFAVIVAADRSIQADFPNVVSVITMEITQRLADNADAKGVLPALEVLKYQSQHPGWVAKPLNDLAKDLGVERVVYIDLEDFALTDPGNPYVYNGVAGGTIHVIEVEGTVATEFAFSETVHVKFPDMTGMSSNQMPRSTVFENLARRFIERSAWMFYGHEEKNDLTY